MSNVTVFKSSSINTEDIITLKGKTISCGLEEENNAGKDLIILYMYILPSFVFHGIKVGMATCHQGETFWHAIRERIRVQKHELALSDDKYDVHGLNREVIYWGVCLDAQNENFKDHNVHKVIKNKCAGIVEKDQEWFTNVPQEDIIDAFLSCKNNEIVKTIYTPRKEQQECIDSLKAYFDKHPTGDRFLLNCKMRFGKCFTTYKYCEEANIKKVLILTFVPAVEESWREDLLHINKDYDYYTDLNLRKDSFTLKDKDSFVVFLSLQNYLGKDNDSNVKAKIKKLQDVHFDLCVLDEYHFGAWNRRTQETLEDMDKDYLDKIEKVLKNKNVLDTFSIKADKTICLSGTPFKAIARGEFTDENSYTYSYFDEQQNKYPNEDKSIVNPDYEYFPDMKILGYNMSNLFQDLAPNMMSSDKILNKKYFSLNQFFTTENDENYALDKKFVYEDEIKVWLEIIKGATIQGKNFPYSNPKLRDYVKHTLWLMPTVNSCIAMTDLLKNDDYFSKYEIINLSNSDVGSGQKALDFLNDGIRASENTGKLGTIAITVNKLTIGVTVKKWFGIFVLKDLASPEQYFQSVFRVQTPYVVDGDIKKKECFVYDFNIDRASALLLKYAKQYESESAQYTKLKIAKLIVKYLPIYINGDLEHPISEQIFYQLAEFGDGSGIPLSRKITNLEKTTRTMDDQTISDMLNDKEVSDIIKRVFAHAKFGKNKANTPPNPSPKGFDSKLRKKGIDDGHKFGLEEYNNYVNFDDATIQAEFEKRLKELIFANNPVKRTEETKVDWNIYANGFTKGYESGVNAPIKKLMSGKDDGIKFASEIKKILGNDIQYNKETATKINNIINQHLNDINNIPAEYRASLYKRWYQDSFKRTCQNTLKPVKKLEKGENSIEDANNVLKHILARLFEFLYISVYRETTFNEIFANADPNTFLEAVGITKKDFKILNKYKIFQEDVLNNYIHEFFINESLGERIDLTNEQVKKQYRNSFDWFGYGITKNETENNVKVNN